MKNYEVRVALSSPIILEGNKLRLDQILIDYSEKPAISRTNDLYHASQSVIGTVQQEGLIVVSDNINPHHLPTPRGTRFNIDSNSGVWQSYKRKVRFLVVDDLTFYCQGDADFIKTALIDIGFIGAYASIGFGEISNVSIEEIEHDYSFVKNGRIMRSIPTGTSLDIDLGDSPLVESSYFEQLEDCYCDQNLVSCYTPIQI